MMIMCSLPSGPVYDDNVLASIRNSPHEMLQWSHPRQWAALDTLASVKQSNRPPFSCMQHPGEAIIIMRPYH